MAMIVGTVTVNSDGTWSGTGMALALMNGIQPWMLAQVPGPPYGPPVTASLTHGMSVQAAAMALALAPMVTYIQSNAVAVAAPNSLASGVPTGTVNLPIT